MDFHGDDGPVSVGYPHFIYDQSGKSSLDSLLQASHLLLLNEADDSYSANFLDGMAEMGLPLVSEPNDGTCVGAMINPSSMNAQNQSRCDSRTAYLDPVIDRPNLHVATEQMVTQVLLEEVDSPGSAFGRLQRAVGVEVCPSKLLPPNSC